MVTHLLKFRRRRVAVLVALVVIAMLLLAARALGAPVDDLYTWIIRCLVAMLGGHVDW